MKTTVEIADALFGEAREVATRDSVTLRELVEEGLALALERRRGRRPFRLRDASVGGHGVVAGVSWDLPRELAYEDPEGGR